MDNQILDTLFSLSDNAYKEFHKKLIPTIDEDRIIGVRTPALRKYAKQIFGSKIAEDFLNDLPHKYYEENNLHAFLIEQIKDFDELEKRLDEFLPFIDNWATCDGLRPKVFKKDLNRVFKLIENWLDSNDVYTIRFATVTLMTCFLDDEFKKEHLDMVMNAICDEYYINMAVAWYYSFALIKQYDDTIKLFENSLIKNKWVHNKSIQKALESARIDAKTKNYLKKLKIK
ncbi:MAG: DNA alkylation repair protein [Clostridia bacterium]|nr:DNA alkylation repair protein [Clostridia bacterium]